MMCEGSGRTSQARFLNRPFEQPIWGLSHVMSPQRAWATEGDERGTLTDLIHFPTTPSPHAYMMSTLCERTYTYFVSDFLDTKSNILAPLSMLGGGCPPPLLTGARPLRAATGPFLGGISLASGSTFLFI